MTIVETNRIRLTDRKNTHMCSKGKVCFKEGSNCPNVLPIIIKKIRLKGETEVH